VTMPFRIGLCALLLAAAAGAEERSEGINSYIEFGGLMVMADGLNKTQSICTTLFPSQSSSHSGPLRSILGAHVRKSIRL